MNEPVKPHHGILFWSVVAVLIIGYGLFNFWVYRWATSGKAPSPTKIWQTVTQSKPGFGVLKGDSLPKQGVTLSNSSPTATVTPSPRPNGPGNYACSAEGDCNLYSVKCGKAVPSPSPTLAAWTVVATPPSVVPNSPSQQHFQGHPLQKLF